MIAPRRLVALAAVTFLIFTSAAAAVIGGFAGPLDRAGVTFVQAMPMRPWLAEAARDVTSLGSNLVLGLVSVIAAGYAALIGRRRMAACLLAAPVGCLVLVGIAKSVVGRSRPHIPLDGPLVFTSSFPSSHAALSAAVFAVGAGILLRMQPSRATAGFVAAVAAGLSLLVGSSRLYLGLHWLSDVIAGWALGLGWACLCLAALERTRLADR